MQSLAFFLIFLALGSVTSSRRCEIDDYYKDVIDSRSLRNPNVQQFNVFQAPSPCENQSGRPDRGISLFISPRALPPTSLPGDVGRTINYNSFPFCLAFTVTILSNEPRYVMTISDPFSPSEESMVSLLVGNSEIIFRMGGVNATFIPPAGQVFAAPNSLIHLQICVNANGEPTLYINCEKVVTAPVRLPAINVEHTVFTFLRRGGQYPQSSFIFTGSVLQMYIARCDSGAEADIVRAQCNALPRNCSVRSPLLQKNLLQIVTHSVQGTGNKTTTEKPREETTTEKPREEITTEATTVPPTVVIGFSRPSYQVNEYDAYAIVEIVISGGRSLNGVNVALSLQSATATNGSDYRGIGIVNIRSASTVRIPIINDDVFELTEEMKFGLEIVGPAPPGVTIEEAETTVSILDDDTLVFCLESVTYEFMEGQQSQGLDVALECGKVGEFTVVLTTTSDDTNSRATATAGLDYMPLLASSSQPSFSGTSTSERVLVNIKADNITEPREFFEVVLSGVEVEDASGVRQVLTDEDRARIILGQKHARVFILDGQSGVNNPSPTTTTTPSCSDPPVEFRLRGAAVPSGSQLDIQTIGIEADALMCVTPFENCCKTNKLGEMYSVHEGSTLPLPLKRENTALYRNRGSSMVRLNHRNNVDDSNIPGLYRCCIPDGCGEEKCIEITLV